MTYYYENIQEIVHEISSKIEQLGDNIITVEPYANNTAWKIFLNSDVYFLITNSIRFFNEWFDYLFKYLRVKFDLKLVNEQLLFSIKNDIMTQLNSLISENKVKESLFNFYFEGDLNND